MLNLFRLDEILKNALAEDIGNGDITTMSTVGAERMTQGRFIAKEEGVICGIPVLKRVFEILYPADHQGHKRHGHGGGGRSEPAAGRRRRG